MIKNENFQKYINITVKNWIFSHYIYSEVPKNIFLYLIQGV